MNIRARGFTLVELLISVAIIATLASIAMPLVQLTVQRSKEQDLRRALRDIRDALDAYKRASDEGRVQRSADQSGYPASLTLLVEGVPDTRSPSGAKLYFLRRIPRDPFNIDSTTPAERTWGVRSFESPFDRPAPGKDIFDVFSLSDKTGLNGMAYRTW